MSSLPVIDVPQNPETAPYWQGLRDGVLLLPRCQRCARYIWYPRGRCPECGSADISWLPSVGTGTVYSRSVIRRGAPQAFADMTPYVVALVELDEGPRIYTNVVGIEPDDVRIGQRVHSTIEKNADGAIALRFSPLNGETHG